MHKPSSLPAITPSNNLTTSASNASASATATTLSSGSSWASVAKPAKGTDPRFVFFTPLPPKSTEEEVKAARKPRAKLVFRKK
ncbi:hypothetical protein NX059_005110 [Plenodomus lindquistii]|nr:hypothetical protein NX059_005110 [Plenodomus lindquistii]